MNEAASARTDEDGVVAVAALEAAPAGWSVPGGGRVRPWSVVWWLAPQSSHIGVCWQYLDAWPPVRQVKQRRLSRILSALWSGLRQR